MNELISYQSRKEEIRRKLRETAENFVYIGYQLKQVKVSREYEQDGYTDLIDFAMKEYGLSKDDTYRFIRINDRYSVGGDSPELDTSFKGIAQTKLSEMLNLPDSDIDLVTPETTREDIRELKRFNNQSQEDIPEKQGSDIQNIIMEFFRPAAGRPAGALHELLMEVLAIVEGKLQDSVLTQEELIQEKINPKGNGTFRTGRYMLFLYDASHGLKYKVFGENENHQVSYLSFAKTVHLIFTSRSQDCSLDPWENIYGKVSEPESEKVETQETGQNEKRPGPGTKAGVDKKKLGKNEGEKQEGYPQKGQENGEKAPAQLEEDNSKETDPESDEIQNHEEAEILLQDSEEDSQEDQQEEEPDEAKTDIKQMEVEDYPEMLPEGYIKCHDGSEVQETETHKKWKDIQSFIEDLHTQITNREEPDLETGRKLTSGVNYLKMIMDDFINMKEELEDE